MNKKTVCDNNKSFGYYSGYGGLEFKYIEYGIDEYIYFVANAWGGNKSYHKSKIYCNAEGDAYIKPFGSRIYFADCIRM